MENARSFLIHEIKPALLEQLPTDWNQVFQRPGKIGVEIGFGNGEYLMNWHRSAPDWNLIGIEISMESCERLMKRLGGADNPPVRVIHENARFTLRECFADNSLSHVIMNCPDPWPKDKHRGRRLINGQFAETLAAVLESGGCYELVTDQPWYAEDAFHLFSHSPHFEVSPLQSNLNRAQTTRYERKWLEMNRTITRLLATKISTPTIDRMCKETTMPHAFINRPIKPEMIRQLTGLAYREADQLFVVKSVLSQMDEPRYNLKVVTSDEGYRQSFLVEIKPHNGGRWLARLDATVQPYRTPAVKMAIRHIAAKLDAIPGHFPEAPANEPGPGK